MDKKIFSIVTYSYLSLLVIIFVIYAFQVADENWVIELDGQRENIFIFFGLLFIGVILSAVNLAGIHEKSNKVTKGMIYGGLSVAAFFLIWKAAMALV
ncbi:hypothetical protein FA727_13590 [Robertmurraya kyonggiensis]|uniref:Uncharacterized protein n=1 Tax=Robertmurraya kyonggiensis TaxID=1037680 RepID=A0A4U1D612_9BACI|nr:hypothetical protein FA727_13590 [Robertmurraya kyonggiensis]